MNYIFYKNFYFNRDSDLSLLTRNFLPLKKSVNSYSYYCLNENKKINKFRIEWSFVSKNITWRFCLWYQKNVMNFYNTSPEKLITAKLVFQDMIHLYKSWRHVKGYPVNGQRTWSNGKSVTKTNNLLKSFRIEQILKNFGQKRKNKAPQLVVGEYTNKLWMWTWVSEWKQARKFNIRSSRKKGKNNKIQVDLKSLNLSITGGYKRKGNASKQNKAKKKFKSITIGLPLFFTRFIYHKVRSKSFPVELDLLHEQRIMKAKRRVIKKKPQKNKKK